MDQCQNFKSAACMGQAAAHALNKCETAVHLPHNDTRRSALGGRVQLFGTTDGVVRLQPVDASTGAPVGRFWQAALHDSQDGRVAAVALSFDGSYLLSAARDGTLYLQETHIEGVSPPAPAASAPEGLVPMAQSPYPNVVDIVNVNEYTIEEAKQKAEQDALVAAAEAKKMGVREQLQQVRGGAGR